MHFGILTTLIVFGNISPILGEAGRCRICASDSLRDIWEVSGLKKPTDIAFGQDCFTYNLNAVSVPCPSRCLDYLFSFKNGTSRNYAIVRGCYDDLVGISANSDVCSYGKTSEQTEKVVYNGEEMADYTRISIYTSTDVKGNINLMNETWIAEGCKQKEQSHTCKLCDELKGEDCKSKIQSTCTGAYCTKIISTINGQTWITRGCAPVNLYQADGCYNSTAAATVLRPLPEKTRSRRDITYTTTSGIICYCTGNECNVASATTGLTSIILFLTAYYLW